LANFLTVNLTFSLVFVNLILKVEGYIDWKIFVDNTPGPSQEGNWAFFFEFYLKPQRQVPSPEGI